MKAITHITASTAAAAVIWPTVDASAALGILVFGGFLDVDHIPLFISSGLPARPSALLRSVFSNEKQLASRYDVRRGLPTNVIFPALHCVEFAAVPVLAGWLLGSAFLLWGGIGVLLHILMDFWSYPCGPEFFSMTWRICNREDLLKEWRGHRSKVLW
jgi:hypothetical protein